MWLINTRTEKIQFVADPELHQYAILSHTWRRDGEPTFQDYLNPPVASPPSAGRRPGAGRVVKDSRFAKIRETCRLARARNIPYAWVDTVCIDKSSSAELTEAINSMFRWYKNAVVCFTYLSDLPVGPKKDLRHTLRLCHWLTRGWTLQELVASKTVEFYDEAWNLRGDKHELCELLSEITRIDEDVLRDSSLLTNIPVARRMSWASTRQTTRVEDMAYSLFGIFDIHLPLIYGEGEKAFLRLQEAIAQDNNDLSLFAWTSLDKTYRQTYRGLFARSPLDFRNCDRLLRILSPLTPTEEYVITNKGIRLTARMNEGLSQDGEKDFLLNLDCIDSSRQQPDGMHSIVFIRLVRTPHGYVRHLADTPLLVTPTAVQASAPQTIYVPKTINPAESQELNKRLGQRFHIAIDNKTPYAIALTRQYPMHLWETEKSGFMTDGNEKFIGVVHLRIQGGYWEEPVEDHDPEFPPVDQEGGPNNFWWPSLWLVVVLRKQERGSGTEAHQHQPWAAIYDHETAKDLTRIMQKEADYGIGHVLEEIGAFIKSQAVQGPSQPSMLGHTVVAPYVPSRKRLFNEFSVKLSISTAILNNEAKGTWSYKLDIEAEHHGE